VLNELRKRYEKSE
jgi:hypothetical protein